MVLLVIDFLQAHNVRVRFEDLLEDFVLAVVPVERPLRRVAVHGMRGVSLAENVEGEDAECVVLIRL